MKCLNEGLCAIFIVFGACLVTASPLISADDGTKLLLEIQKCSWGPTYWCSNLTNAKACNAVRHCIQTVWEKQSVPVDNDSICQICKDMVTQARNQLRSNETLEELKEVFEGSCKLIPINLVQKECCKLADDFIPELVEVMTSQMNPDQVCSVAGLCNNAQIDGLLGSYYNGILDGTLKVETNTNLPANPEAPINVKLPLKHFSCGNCTTIASIISDNFKKANRDEILENGLHLCGQLSSFSDACSNILLTYFSDIYDYMETNLHADGICHLSGVCASKFHQHPENVADDIIELETMPEELKKGDDISCQFCQQLVHHLRDLLVANTTEDEFKQVMEGFCKQTKSFRDECLSIVNQYYDEIYKTLVNNLDANGACFMMGLCPKTSAKELAIYNSEIMPLLPSIPPAEIKITIRKKLGAHEPKFTQTELSAMQLPIDHLMGAANSNLLVDNGQLCTMCEYLLHIIQETLATPAADEEIRNAVEGICNKLPNSIHGQCRNFIDMYGDALIALLIQGLDPRSICPKMQMCPASEPYHVDMEIFAPNPVKTGLDSDKPTCSLCLFAVEQAQEKIRDDKSKKNIKNVLDHLCVHLPQKLESECVDFVETYSNELIDMLITNFKAQEICVALNLCTKKNTNLNDLGISSEQDEDKDIDSTEMSFNEIGSHELPLEIAFEKHSDTVTPNCWMCEEIIKNAEKKIGKNPTKAEIKNALEHSCDRLRKSLRTQCHKYVNKFGDKIADIILKEMEPSMMCREIGMCLWSEQEDLEIDEALKYDVIAIPNEKPNNMGHTEVTYNRLTDDINDTPTCVICEFVMTRLESELKDKTTQEEIKHTIETICNKMPKTVAHSCDKFVDQYANIIINLVGTVPPKEICNKMMLCFVKSVHDVNDEVIECGVCHGATISLLPFFKQHVHKYSITQHDMVSVGCENLPAKYYHNCSEMIRIYGQSILNLLDRSVDPEDICTEIGKCFDKENSSLAFIKISA